jgi:anti-sigma factor RsiW
MSASPDKFVLWDAAYVLRALSPAERSDFEEHLADCAVCQAAVAELAAIPDQLASLSFADATTFRREWQTPTRTGRREQRTTGCRRSVEGRELRCPRC